MWPLPFPWLIFFALLILIPYWVTINIVLDNLIIQNIGLLMFVLIQIMDVSHVLKYNNDLTNSMELCY